VIRLRPQIVGRVDPGEPFCPNIAATPDASQVWFTLKDVGKTQVFRRPATVKLLKTLDTGRALTMSISRTTRTDLRLRDGRRSE